MENAVKRSTQSSLRNINAVPAIPIAIFVVAAVVAIISFNVFSTAENDRYNQAKTSADRKINLIKSAMEPIASRGDAELASKLLVKFAAEPQLQIISVWLREGYLLVNSDGTIVNAPNEKKLPEWFTDQHANNKLVLRSADLVNEDQRLIGKAYLGYRPISASYQTRNLWELLGISTFLMLLFCLGIPVAATIAMSVRTMKLELKPPSWISPMLALARPFQKDCTPLEQKFRINQMTVVTGQMGFNMGLNIVNVVVLTSVAWQQVNPFVLGIWALATLGMVSLGLRTFFKFRHKPRPASVSKRAIKRFVVASWILGTLWAMAIVAFFPYLSHTGQLVIMMMVAGIIAGGGILLAPIPAAALGFIGTVLTGATVSFATLSGASHIVLAFAPLFFGTAMLTISFIKYRHFVKTTLWQQAQLSQERTIKLLLNDFEDTSSDWLWSVDEHGFLERAPLELLAALKAGQVPVSERHLPDILRRLASPEAIDIARKLENREVLRDAVLRVCHDDGTQQWLRISARANEDCGFVINGVAADITKQQEAEAQLEERSRKLETAVKDLEQFAFVASHDLKEPLRKIEAFGSRLDKRFSEELGETGAQYIERMVDASERMRRMIDDLLDFSRISTRGNAFETVDLNNVMADVESDLQVVIDEKQASVVFEKLPAVHGDYTQIRQLVQNLLANAIKFSKPDVAPVVKIKVSDTDEYWQIDLCDNGIGFDSKEAENIFKIFHRLHGRSEYGGTGIGLATVKKIVDRHNGTVIASSTPGEGSTFSIKLPKAVAENPEPLMDMAA